MIYQLDDVVRCIRVRMASGSPANPIKAAKFDQEQARSEYKGRKHCLPWSHLDEIDERPHGKMTSLCILKNHLEYTMRRGMSISLGTKVSSTIVPRSRILGLVSVPIIQSYEQLASRGKDIPSIEKSSMPIYL